jgi:hypothetical protein
MLSPREHERIRKESLQKREKGWQLLSNDYREKNKIKIRQRKMKLEI